MDANPHSDRTIRHDGVVHHPLGGGSYAFKTNFVGYLLDQLYKNNTRISVGAQPNSSPHFGTLTTFSLAFALGDKFRQRGKPATEVYFEMIDTAPAETRIINGIEYQVSLRESGEAERHFSDYAEVLESLKSMSGVPYQIRRQRDFNSQPAVPRVLKRIMDQKDEVAPLLDPENKKLRVRVACPECGLTDKKGLNNRHQDDIVESYCPDHGSFEANFVSEPDRLEFNTPLRNLIRALVYADDNKDGQIPFEWLRVTGSDYAGFYQEQMLYRCASILGYPANELPIIVYTPLVTDWSGAKLSKSLYVKQGAYRYLPPFIVDFNKFKEKLGEEGLKKLFLEATKWLEEPYRLFRGYSAYYFMEMFGNDD